MKKIVLVCLLAFGMNAAMAQCPINEILTTRDPSTIANLIDNNTDCIKQALTQNPDYQNYKVYVDYLYNTASPWVYHTNPAKEKLFADFYEKWGKDYPGLHAPKPTSEDFYKAVDAMVATDPVYFAQAKATKIPAKYIQWLYVRDITQKYGERNVIILTNAAAKIANLPSSTNYSAFVPPVY
jgi:hypothetical protein